MDLLDYKLDKDYAVVVVSNAMVDNASKQWLVVEHLCKVPQTDVEEVANALKVDYEMAQLTRDALDKKRVLDMMSSPHVKRARQIEAYPSDA